MCTTAGELITKQFKLQKSFIYFNFNVLDNCLNSKQHDIFCFDDNKTIMIND